MWEQRPAQTREGTTDCRTADSTLKAAALPTMLSRSRSSSSETARIDTSKSDDICSRTAKRRTESDSSFDANESERRDMARAPSVRYMRAANHLPRAAAALPAAPGAHAALPAGAARARRAPAR